MKQLDAFEQRLHVLVESLNARVAARRGEPLSADEIGLLGDRIVEHMRKIEHEWGPRLQAAREDEVPRIIAEWWEAIIAPIARAALNS